MADNETNIRTLKKKIETLKDKVRLRDESISERDDELYARDQRIKDLEDDATLQAQKVTEKVTELMAENKHLRTWKDLELSMPYAKDWMKKPIINGVAVYFVDPNGLNIAWSDYREKIDSTLSWAIQQYVVEVLIGNNLPPDSGDWIKHVPEGI